MLLFFSSFFSFFFFLGGGGGGGGYPVGGTQGGLLSGYQSAVSCGSKECTNLGVVISFFVNANQVHNGRQ